MNDEDFSLSHGLDADIRVTHERFVSAMGERLGEMGLETKERYFAVLSALVGKLETPEKPLRDVLQEMVAEAASLIFAELGEAR
jgi:hypothetical protein